MDVAKAARVRNTRFLALLIVACAFLAMPGRAATEIPFTFRAGMIWLKLEVAGQSAPLNFLLDSGAGKSVVHLGTARRLGIKLGASETVQGVQGRCVAYRVGRFAATVAAVPVPREILALDLGAVSAGCGARVDGLLGADFFRTRVVQIDFRAQKIRLLSRAEFDSCGGQILPLARRNDAFCIRVGVDRHAPQWMRFDTGYSGALEWVAGSQKARGFMGTSVAVAAASRGHIQTEVLLGAERVSPVRTGVHAQPIFPGEAGLVGNELLSQFQVTVDAERSRLLLRRVAR